MIMGFNFHVGLPGPFSYNKHIGGGRRRRSNKPREPITGKEFLQGLAVIAGIATLVMWFTPAWPVALFLTLFVALSITVSKVADKREWSKVKRGLSVAALSSMFVGGFAGSIAATSSGSGSNPAASSGQSGPVTSPTTTSPSTAAPSPTQAYSFRDINSALPAGIHVTSDDWSTWETGTYREAYVTDSADGGNVDVVQWEANGTGKSAALADLGTPTASGTDWAYTDDAATSGTDQPTQATQPQAQTGYTWKNGHCRNDSTGEFAKNVDCGH